MSGIPTIERSVRPGEDPLNDVVKVKSRCTYFTADLSSNRTVRQGAGHLHSVNICNNSGAVATVTLWDSTAASGDRVRVYTLPAGSPPMSETVDVDFVTGLFVSPGTLSAGVQINLSVS